MDAPDLVRLFLKGETLRAIARERGVTQQAISLRLKKAIRPGWNGRLPHSNHLKWWPRQTYLCALGHRICQRRWLERTTAAQCVYQHLNRQLSKTLDPENETLHFEITGWWHSDEQKPQLLEDILNRHMSSSSIESLFQEATVRMSSKRLPPFDIQAWLSQFGPAEQSLHKAIADGCFEIQQPEHGR